MKVRRNSIFVSHLFQAEIRFTDKALLIIDPRRIINDWDLIGVILNGMHPIIIVTHVFILILHGGMVNKIGDFRNYENEQVPLKRRIICCLSKVSILNRTHKHIGIFL